MCRLLAAFGPPLCCLPLATRLIIVFDLINQTFAMICKYMLNITTLMFAGHYLSTTEVGGLASCFFSVTRG
jgi:hypothetical protein